jgi:hypothetical protein
MVVIKERQGSEGTIRLKCPKRIINVLGIPEKGYLTVHIKGYHRERVRYGVTGSSMRINLGAGFNDLFTDEGRRIIATFKLSENGLLELFYKEDEISRYCLRKKSAKYVEGYGYCSRCQAFYPAEENNYRCPDHHIPLRTSPRKKRNNKTTGFLALGDRAGPEQPPSCGGVGGYRRPRPRKTPSRQSIRGPQAWVRARRGTHTTAEAGSPRENWAPRNTPRNRVRQRNTENGHAED